MEKGKLAVDQWECAFCKGLNGAARFDCWNCGKSWDDTKTKRAPSAEALAAAAAREAAAAERAKRVASAAALSRDGELTFRALLGTYLGVEIRINAIDPVKPDVATLSSVQADHFVIEHQGLATHIPYSQILRVSQVRTLGSNAGTSSLSVEIFHLVVYKGSVSVGMSIPI